jgi:hypothetical protein
MMVAMAQSILSQNGIDARNQAIHYLLWYQHGQFILMNLECTDNFIIDII